MKGLRRFSLITLLVGCYFVANAQSDRSTATPSAVYRLGMIGLQQLPADQPGPFRDLLDRLAEQGFEHGRNLVVAWGPAHGTQPDLQNAAQALVAQGAQVILAASNGPALAASRATRQVPIVAWASGAVASGLVVSLNRPGGNVTGVDSLGADVSAKRIELVQSVLPGPWPAGSRLGVMFNPDDPGAEAQMRDLREAAARVRLEVLPLAVRSPRDIALALKWAARAGHGEGHGPVVRAGGNGRPPGPPLKAMMVLTDALTASYFHPPRDTPDLAGLPTFCELPKFVLRGCLVAFGPSTAEYVQISARLIARLFAQPHEAATLPMEHARRYELTVNRRAAHQLGLVLEPALLTRADSVYE